MKISQFRLWSRSIIAAAGTFALCGAVMSVDAFAQNTAQPTYQNQTAQPGQQQYLNRQNTTRDMTRSMSGKHSCKASDIIGMNVRGKSGDENIGSVEDLMITQDGRVEYIAVSFGGFLGMGDKLFAVPVNALAFEKTGDRDDREAFARIDITEQTLRNKKGFDQENWPEQADRSFLTDSSRPQPHQAARPTLPSDGSSQ